MGRKWRPLSWGMGMGMMAWVGTALSQPADCGELVLEGLWVNPWNASQARLLVSNPTWGWWGYPSWKLADANGVVLGQEQTVYFGIAETSVHDISLAAPWLDAADVPVVLTLYTDFEATEACVFPFTLTPRTFGWTEGGAGDCLPTQAWVQTDGNHVITLTWRDGDSGEVLWTEVLPTELSAGYMAYGEVECLDQGVCLELELAAEAQGVQGWLRLQDPSVPGLFHHEVSFETGADGVGWVGSLDLYGESCGTSGTIAGDAEAGRGPGWSPFPNPGTAAGWSWTCPEPGTLRVFDPAGSCLLSVPVTGQPGPQPFALPLGTPPGVYLLTYISPAGIRHARWTLAAASPLR